MANDSLESRIAAAIELIRSVEFVAPDWVARDLSDFLARKGRYSQSGYHPKLTRLQKWLRRPGYPTSLPRRVRKILRNDGSRRGCDIRKRVQRLRLKDRHAKVLLRYLDNNYLSVLGFPLFGVGDSDDLFAASLYRFAYGDARMSSGTSIEIEEFFKAAEFAGAYRIYLRRAGLKNIERRILVLQLLNAKLFMAAEISFHPPDRLLIRSGPIAPAFDFQTLVLTDQWHNETVERILAPVYDTALSAVDRIDLAKVYHSADDVLWLQAQNLQFYAIRNESSSILAGTFHCKGDTGQVIGVRLPAITADDFSIASLGVVTEAEIKDLPDADAVQRILSNGDRPDHARQSFASTATARTP